MLTLLWETPAFQEWQSEVPSEKNPLEAFQYYTARVDQAITLLDWILPSFVEHEGLILRERAIPEDWHSFIQAAQQHEWSKNDVEYVINHVHILDMFGNDDDLDNIPEHVLLTIARAIADSWLCKLKHAFPNLRLVVGVEDENDPQVFAHVAR